VDEFTGRLMPGRRWSDGLHQAVEAKEKVKIERENQTLATVTFQNYFRKYGKLAGMTGTADTEAEEFAKIYKLDVVVIPPNRPRHRHSPRRQPRVHGAPAVPRGRDRRAAAERRRAVRRGRALRLLLSPGRLLSRAERGLPAHLRALQETDGRRARSGRRHQRPAHPRHGAPRSTTHRQPAARPRRPSGRPGLVAVLPVARRRPDADLRIGPHLGSDATPRHGRRGADRARDGDEGDRAGAEAGRGSELLRQKTSARVRRRDEQAARERLRAAPPDPRRADQA